MKSKDPCAQRRFEYLPVLALLMIVLTGCVWAPGNTEVSVTSDVLPPFENEILNFPDGKRIQVDEANRSTFVTNAFGPDYLHPRSSTVFYWTETSANDVILDLNKRLSDAGWQLTTDWGHRDALILGTWEKGNLELTFLLLNDLDSTGIDSLSQNYGIAGPEPGSTLLVIHLRERTASEP